MPDADPSKPRSPGRALARTLAATLLTALGACTSQIPEAIREAPAKAVEVAQAQQDPARLMGQRVRWGGTIIAVNNLPATTEVEVLARRLDADGEPRTQGEGRGRFIAQIAGFLDPAEYEKDRALTVAGTLAGVQTRPVGDYPYAYPVVRVETRYLWPRAPPPGAYGPYGYPGYGYVGWYGPWGPWFGPGFGPWFGPGWVGHAPYRGRRPVPGRGPLPGPRHWRR